MKSEDKIETKYDKYKKSERVKFIAEDGRVKHRYIKRIMDVITMEQLTKALEKHLKKDHYVISIKVEQWTGSYGKLEIEYFDAGKQEVRTLVVPIR
ncbi:hypothetical protein KAR91_18355 [Candidatus Pacearchaeota archaeon]|nr:hypothetical protein [Candidatus Pacearchaeota archaeon]